MWLILCCCSSYVIQIQALVSPYCDTPTQRFLILPPTHHLLAVLAHKQFSYSGGKKITIIFISVIQIMRQRLCTHSVQRAAHLP